MFRRKTKVMPGAGALAPGFELAGVTGELKSLGQILSDGPALLAFFKVACPVCQFIFPYLERLSGGSGLQIVGISQDDASSTQAFMGRLGVTCAMLLDRSEDGYEASNAYGISSVPALFLVEPDGHISKQVAGFSKQDLEALGTRAGVAAFRPGEQVPEWKAG